MRFRVSGHVQGVCFRAATRSKALSLGLLGHARNLQDGDVEVAAVGDATSIASLEVWLRHGPALARVTGVSCEALDSLPTVDGFAIY